MKRQLSFCMAIFLVMICVAAAVPAAAAEDMSWATLHYVYDPLTEGGEGEKGIVNKDFRFTRAVTVTCNTSVAELKLDGVLDEDGSVRLEKADRYTLIAVKKDTREELRYTVYMEPVINLSNGQVFTSYPVIECTNADQMSLDADRAGGIKNLENGTQITGFGTHNLQVRGEKGETFNYTFYIKACTAEQQFDETLGKYCLNVKVGEFEGDEVVVTLDGDKQLAAGSNLITQVGQHSVAATLNGEELTSLAAFPSQEELRLQVELLFPAGDLKEPLNFRFSRYDGAFYLLSGWNEADGTYKSEKLIDGDYRMEAAGDHVIVVKDANGNVVENAFLVRHVEEEEGTSSTHLRLTFDNPHHFYVIFLFIPVVVLFALAAWFFIRRRRIV